MWKEKGFVSGVSVGMKDFVVVASALDGIVFNGFVMLVELIALIGLIGLDATAFSGFIILEEGLRFIVFDEPSRFIVFDEPSRFIELPSPPIIRTAASLCIARPQASSAKSTSEYPWNDGNKASDSKSPSGYFSSLSRGEGVAGGKETVMSASEPVESGGGSRGAVGMDTRRLGEESGGKVCCLRRSPRDVAKRCWMRITGEERKRRTTFGLQDGNVHVELSVDGNEDHAHQLVRKVDDGKGKMELAPNIHCFDGIELFQAGRQGKADQGYFSSDDGELPDFDLLRRPFVYSTTGVWELQLAARRSRKSGFVTTSRERNSTSYRTDMTIRSRSVSLENTSNEHRMPYSLKNDVSAWLICLQFTDESASSSTRHDRLSMAGMELRSVASLVDPPGGFGDTGGVANTIELSQFINSTRVGVPTSRGDVVYE